MSFAHIQLKKTKEENGFAFFSVLSPDFNEDMAWQEVAEVVAHPEKVAVRSTPHIARPDGGN